MIAVTLWVLLFITPGPSDLEGRIFSSEKECRSEWIQIAHNPDVTMITPGCQRVYLLPNPMATQKLPF